MKFTENFIIRTETSEDFRKTENLTREAFWNVYRPGCTEHYILHTFRSRADFIPELSLVMEKDGEIIGHVMYAKSQIKADSGEIIPVITAGPISIAPDYQRKGYGRALLDYSAEKAKSLGEKVICIEGNIDFYGKSGFVFAHSKGIFYDGAPKNKENPYFLIKETDENFLDGVTGTYCVSGGYFIDENESEEFDKQFPFKQKLKLFGQLI